MSNDMRGIAEERLKSFKEFAKTAKLRCGYTFVVISVQRSLTGEPSSIRGFIDCPVNEADLLNKPYCDVETYKQNMMWSLEGSALLFGKHFDLVVEEAL